LRTGRYNLGIGSSCIVYRLGDTVIDTGPPNQWPVVRRFLRERNVEQVLVTHHHEDHSGNGARLQRELKATVFFPPSGVALARDGFPPAGLPTDNLGHTETIRSPGDAR